MNFTFLTGNVGVVKEVVVLDNSKVLNFTVAVNKHYKNKKGEKTTETVWYDCALWNRENIFPYIKSGSHVTIQGEVSAKAYIKDGKAIAVLTCTVDTIEFSDKVATE